MKLIIIILTHTHTFLENTREIEDLKILISKCLSSVKLGFLGEIVLFKVEAGKRDEHERSSQVSEMKGFRKCAL